jgi:hypothetical protein
MLLYHVRSSTQLVTKNDVTGDSIQTKVTSKKYLDNYDAIFGKKNKKVEHGDEDGEENTNASKTKENKN